MKMSSYLCITDKTKRYTRVILAVQKRMHLTIQKEMYILCTTCKKWDGKNLWSKSTSRHGSENHSFLTNGISL